MREVCEETAKPNMSARLARSLDRHSFDPAIRSCSAAFVELQALRHDADYNPSKRIGLMDARAAAENARRAIGDFNASPEDQRQLFLTLLHFKARP